MFIGGLSWDTTDGIRSTRTKLLLVELTTSPVRVEGLKKYFSQFGKVIDSTVMLDRETGRSKGFGFVSFEDADVEPILGFGKLEIDGKMVCRSFCGKHGS